MNEFQVSEHTVIYNYFLTNTALDFPSKPDICLSEKQKNKQMEFLIKGSDHFLYSISDLLFGHVNIRLGLLHLFTQLTEANLFSHLQLG